MPSPEKKLPLNYNNLLFLPTPENPIPQNFKPPDLISAIGIIISEEEYLNYIQQHDKPRYHELTENKNFKPNSHPKIREIYKNELLEMMASADNDGHIIILDNGFRSHQDQLDMQNIAIRNRVNRLMKINPNQDIDDVKTHVEKEASARVKPPGLSRHGVCAIDLNPYEMLEAIAVSETSGKPLQLPDLVYWLRENSWKYGFIVAFTENARELVDFDYEPWHVEFIGKKHAKQFHQKEQKIKEKGEDLLLYQWLKQFNYNAN
ncbi:MAG: D-alanyl-D-alanine carboxypeptidase family protein [Candidatus Beckwithbacteria bacterium]